MIPDRVLFVGTIPGLLGLATAIAGYGAMRQRLDHVETELNSMKQVYVQVATIAERTRNMDVQAQAMRENLEKITDHLLDDGRTFAQQLVRQDRTRQAARRKRSIADREG